MKQLVLFQGEPVPESRAKALVKIEKEHGKDAAVKRNMVYSFYGAMKEKITEKTGAAPGMAIISRQRSINKAAGIEGVNKCGPEKYGTILMCCNVVINAYDIESPTDRSDFIKAGLGLVAKAEAMVNELFSQQMMKQQEQKAA